MRKTLFFLRVFFFFVSFPTASLSQSTTIEGFIYEDSTEIPISFAKVYILGTQIGTFTDTNGYFILSTPSKKIIRDSIRINYLGFIAQVIPILKDETQSVVVNLKSSLFLDLGDVTVRPGENPAWRFMRKLIAEKKNNNPEMLNYSSFDEYSKVRFDLNHFTDKIKKTLLFRPFDYIWDNTQVTEDGIQFLPVLITERFSEHYYRKSPRDNKDIIISEKKTGLAGPNLVNFTNDLYITPNIYDNYIEILGKSFPSPLNDNYKNNYKFYLMDSSRMDGIKTYKIRFVPKSKRDLAFTGEMYFDSTTYAIKEITLKFDLMANVNFIRSYYITQFFSQVDSMHWMPSETRVVGDFTVFENSSDLTGFFGRKQSYYSNYTVNESIDKAVFKGIEKFEISDSTLVRDEAFWLTHRPTALTTEEKGLQEVSKRVAADPAFKIRKYLAITAGTGYIPFKPFELGILSMASYNSIEKIRLKLHLRTNPNQKFPIHTNSYLAYGFGDARLKYRLGGFSRLNKKNTWRIGGYYSHDIEQLGRSFNQIAIDHVIGSVVQVGQSSSRNYVSSFESYLEKELFQGCIARFGYFNQQFEAIDGQPFREFVSLGDTSNVNGFNAAGFRATFKFSFLFDKLKGEFYDKNDLYAEKRRFPDAAITYDYSDKKLFGSNFDYQKVKMSIRQKVNAKKLGYLNYTVEAGKTFGAVPYTFLDIPFGNQLLIADAYSFNLMNFMEYASDQYVMVHATHHFDGLILDRIPLINKLKFRSFIFGKTFIGSLSDANNQQRYLFPEGLNPISAPYFEFGFGLENIFKFFKIDFIWRPTPGVDEYYKFLVKPSFKFAI
ncbi:MAG: hypothetical protein ACJASQ_001138 [Crocinitomicaceae bacterium]|jgi:hypothetical protein